MLFTGFLFSLSPLSFFNTERYEFDSKKSLVYLGQSNLCSSFLPDPTTWKIVLGSRSESPLQELVIFLWAGPSGPVVVQILSFIKVVADTLLLACTLSAVSLCARVSVHSTTATLSLCVLLA